MVGLCLLGGCYPTGTDLYMQLQDEDPSVRNQAIVRAGQLKDQKAIPFLVDRLTDSQEDCRLFAILALDRITGRTMGYNYYEPADKRAEAVRRWRQWMETGRSDKTAKSQLEVNE